MSMVLNPRRLDDVVILDLSGRITIGEGTLIIRDHLQKLLNAGDRKFLLNLSDVDYIDSSGLGRTGDRFHDSPQSRWTTQTPEPHQTRSGSPPDHETAYRFRSIQ